MKVFSTRQFISNVRELLKSYPHVIADIAPLLAQLKKGETPGDRVPRVEGRLIFKVRAPNRDAQSGKSGGYRVLYYLIDSERRLLLAIYTKTRQEDISTEMLIKIVEEWEST